MGAVLFVLLAAGTGFAADASPTRILVLNSWHKDMPWQVEFETGLKRELEAIHRPFTFYAEYLDAGRFSEREQQDAFYAYLHHKYARLPLDFIIAESRPASTFLSTHPELFPGVKRLFVQPGSQEEHWGPIDTVITVATDYAGSIDEMARLADPEHVYIIIDSQGISGQGRLKAVKAAVAGKPRTFNTVFLENLPMEDLLDRVSRLPPDSAILYLLIFHDGAGKAFIPYQAATLISEQANAPVFTHWTSLMGSSVLGGYLLAGDRVGADAARALVDLQDGNTPLTAAEAYGVYYDWRQLQRWNIDESRLPPDAEILYREPSFFAEYRWQIVATLSALAVLFVLSVVLIVVDRKRKWAMTALRKERLSLEQRVEERTTELNDKNRELETAATALERSNAELQQFAYVSSHDLREPLRMVSSYLQLLERRYRESLDDDAREYIGFAVDGAKRMDGLIKNLLEYSRIETHGEMLAPMDPREALLDALDNLHTAITEAEGTVTYDDAMPLVLADRHQLVRLFQNLIANALKYRAPDRPPEIHVGATPTGGGARFSVRDNGLGIDPDYFDRIFVIFQRLHGREEYGGYGVGLSVCKKIVERHGGRIWVESDGTSGSTFLFTLEAVD